MTSTDMKVSASPVAKLVRIPLLLLVALMAAVTIAAPAAAIDVDAGDWEAPPAGMNLGLIYYQHATRDTLYAQGTKVLDDAQLSSDVGLFRYMHTFDVGGLVVGPQFILPVGRLKANGDLAALGNASGVGDLLLAMPVWVVNKPKERTYLGFAPYVFVPIGSYDHDKPLNLGENRWKVDLQVGGEIGLPGDFVVEATMDALLYFQNSNFGPGGMKMKQDPLFHGQLYLSYLWTPGVRVAVGVKGLTGGETNVDGVAKDDKTQTVNGIITASAFVDQHNQLLFSVGRDLAVKNGLAESFRFNFRFLHVF